MPDQLQCVQYLQHLRIADGGIVNFLINHCQALANKGHQVTLLTEDDADVPDAWRDKLVTSPRVVRIKKSVRGVNGVSTELKDVLAEADVLHFHCLWDVRLRQLTRLAREFDLPYVVSTHGMLDDWAIRSKHLRKRAYMLLAGRRILHKAAFVHCASEGERRQARNWLARDNSRVIPLSFDRSGYELLPGPELIQQRFPELAKPEPKILMLSRLHPVKRIELLVDTVAMLRDQGLTTRLVVAGPCEVENYASELRRRSSKLGLCDLVHFVGSVEGDEKISLYQCCDLFALPSWQENFGMVLAEAMAAETPVVTTRAVDTWPEIESGGGQIVEPTPQAFAAVCQRLLSDPNERAELGRRGRQHVFAWLDAGQVLDGYVSMYRDAIAGHTAK